MDLRSRAPLVVLALACLVITLGTAAVDLPRSSGGHFWGDGATYYAMAWSLAEDGDLAFDGRDLARVRREFPSGPQGIFMKRAHGGVRFDGGFRRLGPDEKQVYFAKAFVYPVFAAPFVKLLGTRGLLVTNGLFFAAALAAMFYVARRRGLAPWRALLLAGVLLGATVAPIYLVWPAPEVMNIGLIAGGLAAWVAGRPWLSAVLFGLATYSKPYNLFTALPLGAEPFLPGLARQVENRGRVLLRGLGTSVARGLVLGGVVAALFGLNAAITGEANYQGGERKTFYGEFPGDIRMRNGLPEEVTFGNTGIWMTTNRLGATVEGEEPLHRGEGPPRAQSEIDASFRRNLGYFWYGRFGGALAYFLPAVLALALFLARRPRDAQGWLAAAGIAVSWLFYTWMIPDNWYGGGGTVGNRYFLNLLPLAVFLVPAGREALVAVPGVAWAAWALGAMLASPFVTSMNPGRHAVRAPFRWFPAELTMLNDLAVFTERWRKKRSVGDTEGDAHKHWPADPKAYYLYFPDDGTRGLETVGEQAGFRVCGDAEVILRALEPVRRMRVRVRGEERPTRVSVSVAGRGVDVHVGPGREQEAVFEPGPGFQWYDTFLHRLRLVNGAPGGSACGPFVWITLEVDKRPR